MTGAAGSEVGHPGRFKVCTGTGNDAGAVRGTGAGTCNDSAVADAGEALGAALDVGRAQPATEGPTGLATIDCAGEGGAAAATHGDSTVLAGLI